MLVAVDGQGRAELSTRILTVPNVLSAFRLLLVPVFLGLILVEQDVAALLVLVLSGATDYLDGVIARRFHQITRLGQLLDPAADRLFIFATLIGLAAREIVPWWLVAVVVGRDVFLAVLGIVLASHGFGPLPVHQLGKVATFCLFYALPLLLLSQAVPAVAIVTVPVGWALALWGAFLYWWGGLIYARETARVIASGLADDPPVSDTLGR